MEPYDEAVKTVEVRAIRPLRLVLWLHTAQAPRPEDWAPAIETALDLAAEVGDPKRIRMLAVSDGGAPDAGQRKQVIDGVYGGGASRMSVITNAMENPIMRGIITALRWVNPELMAVRVSAWQEAFAHIDLEQDVQRALDELEEMQRELPTVQTLAELRRQVSAAG